MKILEDYTTTIDLSGTRAKQFIFAGQLYGTFFAIFASFKIDLSKSTNTKKVIKKITLEILNYKGIVDIGILSAQIETGPTAYLSEIKNSTTISIQLQALCKNKTTDVVGVTGLELIKGSWLIFDRHLNRIDKKANPNVWDQEFDYRDGLFNQKNIKRYDNEARDYYREQSLLTQQEIEKEKSEVLIDETKTNKENVGSLIEKEENISKIKSIKGITRICVVGQSKILF